MADDGMIEALVLEAAGCVPKKIHPEERDAFARSVAKHLGALSNEELAGAFDRWIAEQDDDRPPFKLPAVQTLRRYAAEEHRRRSAEAFAGRHSAEDAHAPAVRPEFVRAHAAFNRAVRSAGSAMLVEHDHRSGWEGCRVCGPAGEERRARIDELLADLPEPLPGGPRPCRCDGTGWIEVQDPHSRDVYPCSECNRYFFVWCGASAKDGR